MNDEAKHLEGMRVARSYAAWHLGDPSWADAIVDAYLHPERAKDLLDKEKKEIW